jgi:hypothetical protein
MAALGVVFGITLQAYLPSLVPAQWFVAANSARATSRAATEVLGHASHGLASSFKCSGTITVHTEHKEGADGYPKGRPRDAAIMRMVRAHPPVHLVLRLRTTAPQARARPFATL